MKHIIPESQNKGMAKAWEKCGEEYSSTLSRTDGIHIFHLNLDETNKNVFSFDFNSGERIIADPFFENRWLTNDEFRLMDLENPNDILWEGYLYDFVEFGKEITDYNFWISHPLGWSEESGKAIILYKKKS